MNVLENIKKRFDKLQQEEGSLNNFRDDAYREFNKRGIPTVKNEEWKYTRISTLFNREFELSDRPADDLSEQWTEMQLPGHDEANALVFVNGRLDLSLSIIRSDEL